MTINMACSLNDSKLSHPLIVDLDGTLICTDMLHETAIRVLKENPFHILLAPYWLLQGKAVLKRHLANHTNFDASSLPYNYDLIEWLKQQKSQGRKIILCTASDLSIATSISEYLGIFDEVLASNRDMNLAGKHKANVLVKRFGHAGFDYIGNSIADMQVWEQARRGVVVNASEAVVQQASKICEIEKIFPVKSSDFATWRRVLRLHQWLKNLLLFIPLLAAHQFVNINTWLVLVLAFFAFSLCASSVYIANDLFDLESDRQHPRKCIRPFASGLVPIWKGAVLAPLLLLGSFSLAWLVGGTFLSWLVFYFVLTSAYSWGLKRLLLVDCLILAMLYTLRIVAGTAAANMELSFWLLAFAVFLFLSLAFIKRYAELEMQLLRGKEKIHGRGYHTSDAPLIQTMGITSGYAAVLVLALYLNSDKVIQLYRTPEFIWGTVPVMLFWISWMWMKAHRGEMHDDPLVFALKDKASLLAGLVFATMLLIAARGWVW